MTAGDPETELRPAADTGAEPPQPPTRDLSPTHGPGLGSLHATLDRMVHALALRSLTVVIDDPDLGRQAFRAGPGPFESGALAGPPGCRADPPLPPERVDADLLVELCATSLQLEMARADADATGVDAAEIALRRLPGVHAVVVERDGDLMVVQVHASADAPSDLARSAARASAPLADTRVVVEVVRAASEPPPPPAPVPVAALMAEPEPAPPPSIAVPSPAGDVPVIVAVRNDAETGELEIHVRGNDMRTIGRAPVAQGLAGAVNATLDALRGIDPTLDLALGWARTIETTADRRFVVAVALLHGGTRASRHGLASGDSPTEAAARAALDAVGRDTDSDT